MFGPGTYRPDPTEGRGYDIQSHFFALSLPPPVSAGGRCSHAAAARRRSSQQGVARQGAVWTGGGGWGTVERQGFTGVEGLGTTGLKTRREIICPMNVHTTLSLVG